MAVIMQMTYQKKLGLPNFSSHSCSVSIQAEIADLTQVTGEAKRLYALVQDAVDREIQQVGWMPADPAYGLNGSENGHQANGNGHHTNGNGHNGNGNGNGHRSNGNSNGRAQGGTAISDNQLDLINKIVRENNLDKNEIDQMAVDMFGAGVKGLNKMQASNFIDELFAQHGKSNGNGHRGRYQQRERSRS